MFLPFRIECEETLVKINSVLFLLSRIKTTRGANSDVYRLHPFNLRDICIANIQPVCISTLTTHFLNIENSKEQGQKKTLAQTT